MTFIQSILTTIRPFILLLIVTLALPAAIGVDELAARVAAFHVHYNAFMRALYGCPKKARDIEECDPKQGSIDYGEYLKAAKAAKKLFPEDPK